MNTAVVAERFVAQIMARDFQLSCAPEEKLVLLDAVEMVDARMCAVRDGGKIKSADRIAVMVALNLAVELLAAKGLNVEGDGLELKRKIDQISALADAALAEQEILRFEK